ncbi:MAG: murein biosynthesis integral membrane protein MurJ [Chlamydiales bacterium]
MIVITRLMIMIQDSSDTVTNSFKRFLSGTMISRMTGLIREMTMAAAFGTIPAVAAFWMAFRFAHLLRRLFGEGVLNVAFTPHFETLRHTDPKEGARFFFDLSTGLSLFLLFSILLIEGILGSFFLFKEMSPNNREVISLTMIMLPALIFISLYALNSALLNCEYWYFLPSVAPAFLNLVWLMALVFLWRKPPNQALQSLAMILVFAFALQWLVTLPPVYRYLSKNLGKNWWQNQAFSGQAIVRIISPFFLGIIGVGATQLNSAMDVLFARAAHPEGPAFLWYAIRIQQLPFALLGVGLTGAILPPMSRAIESKDWEKYKFFLNFALKKILVLMIPTTVAIFVVGFSGVNLVYGHGAFSFSAIFETTFCLWAYGAGLFPMTVVLIFATAFYGQKNYRLPTLISLGAIGLNIGLNSLFVFVFGMGAVSVAIATTLTACVNGILLLIALKKISHLELDLQDLGYLLIKVMVCAVISAFFTSFIGFLLFKDNTWPVLLGQPMYPFPQRIPQQILIFCTLTFSFSGIFLSLAHFARLRLFLDFLPKKKSPLSRS